MPEFALRKIALVTEEIFHEGGPVPSMPRRRAAALALVKNPFAGGYAKELESAMEDLKPLGIDMADRLVAALGGDISVIDGFGKGAIVGTDGELEHGALWHVPGGYAMRKRLGDSKAIVPSSKKVGAFGARIDIPLGHINAAMCAAISMRWKWGCRMARARTRSCLCLPWPADRVSMRAWAA